MTVQEWLRTFVREPSVNPKFSGGDESIGGESRMAAALATAFTQVGAAQVETREVRPGRPNVIARFRGRSAKYVGWDIHSDTVGIQQMTVDPFGGAITSGRVYGRGAVDTKASYAVAFSLLEEALAHGWLPEHNLIIFATMGEEDGHVGAGELNAWGHQNGIRLEMMLVAEPTQCAPVYAHNGVVRMAFVVEGTRAHTACPDLGINAVIEAIPLQQALHAEKLRLLSGTPTATGLPQLTITKVEGGNGGNTVPDRCYIEIDRRLVPGEDPDTVTAQLTALARRACARPITIPWQRGGKPVCGDPASPAVQHFAALSGNAPATAPYGTNADQYSPELVRDVVVFGPGNIEQAHTADEYVEIAELERARAICRQWLNFR